MKVRSKKNFFMLNQGGDMDSCVFDDVPFYAPEVRSASFIHHSVEVDCKIPQ
jgi:hypothetical protein